MSVRGENEERQGAGTEREAQRGGTERGAGGGAVVFMSEQQWMSAIFSPKNTVKSGVLRREKKRNS